MLHQPILGTYKEEHPRPSTIPGRQSQMSLYTMSYTRDMFYHVIDDLQLRPEQEQHMSY